MPRGNGTGPRGMGQMTGRGVGFCSGSTMPGYENPQIGRAIGVGFGRGRGFSAGGRGWRNCFFATRLPVWMRFGSSNAGHESPVQPDPEMEKQKLGAQVGVLERELDFLKKRLASLESGADDGQ